MKNKSDIIHVSDYYHDKTGHALNNVVERLAKTRKIKVHTSKKNIFDMPYDDSLSLAKIKRFRGVRIGSKTIFLGLIPQLLFKNLEIVHSYVMGFFSTFIVGYLRKIKKFKMILFSDFDEAVPLPKSLFGKLWWNFFVKIPSKSADIITVFTSQQKKYLSKLLKYPENQIKIVPSGVDLKLFQNKKSKKQLRKELGLPEDKFILINVGNFGKKRKYEQTLEILKEIKEKNAIFLHIGGIGDKKYYSKIKKLINNLNLNKQVLFLGAKPFNEIINYYHASDIFLLTSNNESFGIPIIEAMAAGLPVITTRVGVAEDSIENGKNGFIIKNKIEGIKIINELVKNEKMKKEISKNAKETSKEYDWGKIIEKIEKIYF
jgi:glycosyltransferase involved in cell wall biosynthesis